MPWVYGQRAQAVCNYRIKFHSYLDYLGHMQESTRWLNKEWNIWCEEKGSRYKATKLTSGQGNDSWDFRG